MLCGRSIRRLTPEEIDKRREQSQARYEEIYAEIEAAERAEYDEQFGAAFQTAHPFKPDGARVHAKVVARMTQESSE